MQKENIFRLLFTLVALGAAFVSFLAAIFHRNYIIILTIISLIILYYSIRMDNEKTVHVVENLEKAVFFFTLFMIIVSFIYLYKPY